MVASISLVPRIETITVHTWYRWRGLSLCFSQGHICTHMHSDLQLLSHLSHFGNVTTQLEPSVFPNSKGLLLLDLKTMECTQLRWCHSLKETEWKFHFCSNLIFPTSAEVISLILIPPEASSSRWIISSVHVMESLIPNSLSPNTWLSQPWGGQGTCRDKCTL